ncbi:homing endonuclease associated repeat-containing protein [Anaerosalibacter massiliensis]|uniref:homing endonuclease associated repeat-containing protein n=1 Tax=Anaerosalibacter massiliensis TaxID=1347392 RepID=UPI0006788ADE|nr:AP2 domain-containing protein [Anaerosalibacter massiliensis]
MNITNEELINQVRILADELKRTPKMREFKFAKVAGYRFKSWNNFLRTAGLKPNLIINDFDNLTNKELLEIVDKELDRIGSTTFSAYNKHKSKNAPSFSYVKKRTGLKWNEMLEVLNKELNIKNMTNEELLQQLKDVANKTGKTPSKNDLFNMGINADIYYSKFGGYNNALELAGLKTNFNKNKVVHSDEELLKMYVELCKKIGKPATSRDIDDNLQYSSDVFVMRFGSINKLRELAGYNTVDYTKKYSKGDIKIKLIAAYKEKGRRLKNHELKQLSKDDSNFPSISTVCRHFNTTKISKVWEEIEKEYHINTYGKDLIEQVQTLAKEMGKTPTVKDFELSGKAQYIFGSWNNFIKKAGLKPNIKFNNCANLSTEKIIEMARKEIERIGSTSSNEYVKHRSIEAPSYDIIKKKLCAKTWNEALIKMGFSPNNYSKKSKKQKQKNKKCKVSYCNAAARAKGYCGKHYNQIWTHGCIKDGYTDEEIRQYTERMRNRKSPVNSKTGVKGVRINKNGTYSVRIVDKGKEYHLGTYDTLAEAKKARLEGEKKYWGKIYTKD